LIIAKSLGTTLKKLSFDKALRGEASYESAEKSSENSFVFKRSRMML